VIPRRHVADYFEMTVQERADADDLLRVLRNTIRESDPTVAGFNVT